MLLSTKAQYAVKAVVTLAHAKAFPGGSGPMLVRDLAKRSHVPSAFLGKIISELSTVGLLKSQKGRGGGVALARHPKTIRLGECIESIDRVHGQNRCMLNPRPCRDATPCPLHSIASRIRQDVFGRTNLAEIAKDVSWMG